MNRKTDSPAERGLLPIERVYTTRGAARILDVTSGHLRNMRLVNRGPRWIVTADGTVRYPESALREYLSGVAA